ncbi:sensor histidine kinase [Sciscionella sediminilitoris]|uniref:sensor histidine kinase n=1 Tax=Sciscionella sediminilitoris TaxID=1445613 RepID=UPI00056CF0EF|nr:ATP-binding protein [Sciscionella sp. SE31]
MVLIPSSLTRWMPPVRMLLSSELAWLLAVIVFVELALHVFRLAEVPVLGLPGTAVGTALAAMGGVLALLYGMLARVHRADERLPMLATAWAGFALIALPLWVVAAGSGNRIAEAGRLFATVLFLGLLACALGARRYRWICGLRGLAGTLVLTVAVLVLLAVTRPVWLWPLTDSVIPLALALAAALVLAAAFAVRGVRAKEPALVRNGLGLALLGAGQLAVISAGTVATEATLLRVLGLAVLIWGPWRELCAAMRTDAVRDHEIGNALANLAAVPELRVEREEMAGILRAELGRLTDLYYERGHEPGLAEVSVVLHRLAALHRVRGMEVSVEVPERLCAALPGAVLTQTVSNALINCARHAAGAPVRIDARADGELCLIDVTDSGPGPRSRSAAGGRGIGLALSRRLLAGHRGSITLRPAERGFGCTARIAVPLAGARAS